MATTQVLSIQGTESIGNRMAPFRIFTDLVPWYRKEQAWMVADFSEIF